MSDQPIPQPVPLSAGPLDPNRPQPAPADRPRCRALTVDGHRCKNKVVGGLHLCFSHYRNRRPALPPPRYVSVPLLEDRSAIQLMTTQVLHGILTMHLEPARARAALYALHIAALTLPRPVASSPAASSTAASSASGQADPDAADDAVYHIGRDHEDFISADGDLSAPALNPSCSVPESDHAVRELLDTLEPRNRCHPEDEPPEMIPCDPTHDFEHCACHTCADYRERHAQVTADLRAGNHWFSDQAG